MSKTKTSGLTHYEILFIIPNKFTDDEAKKVSEQVEKILTDGGASITLRDYWGKKKLAYEIKHNSFGYYSLFEFDLNGAQLAAIDKSLRLFSDILRHQIVVKKQKTAEELEKTKKIQAKIESKRAEKKKVEEEKAAEAAPKKPAKESKRRSGDLKDLDQKLEGILNAKDLI